MGHSLQSECNATLADGRRIVSGSQDHTLIVWDAHTGNRLTALEGHTAPVTAVCWYGGETAVSDDAAEAGGRSLASASLDSSIRMWEERLPTSAGTSRYLVVLRGGCKCDDAVHVLRRQRPRCGRQL